MFSNFGFSLLCFYLISSRIFHSSSSSSFYELLPSSPLSWTSWFLSQEKKRNWEVELKRSETEGCALLSGDGPRAYICERWCFASRLLTDTWQPSILVFLGTADGEMGEWESAKRMFRWQVVIALTQRYCTVEVGSPFGREIVFSSGQFGNWSHTIDGGNQWCSRAQKILAGGGGSSIAAASDWTTSWSHVSNFSSAPATSAHLLPQNVCLFDVANLCLLFSRGRLLYIKYSL